MGRAAGGGSTYRVAVVDHKGKVRGEGVSLPSVTTILGALPKEGLQWWGYKLGVHAAHEWIQSHKELGEDAAGYCWDAAQQHQDEWYETCKN